MLYVLLPLLFILLVYGPALWIRYVMWRHSSEYEDMPGTGGELAEHLVDRFELEGVTVEEGVSGGDHYNPADRIVSLSPEVYHCKSVTAVAVAAHEVGHAIQFTRGEPVSQLRERYMGKAVRIRQAGTLILMSIPVVTLVFKSPVMIIAAVVVGVVTMLASVLMYVAILPEEFDASFRKALPILEEGYVPEDQIAGARKVLRAAALTYVAAALTDVLSLWRWLSVFR